MKEFTCTSELSYDKHNYKIVYKNNKFKIFDNYYDLLLEWNKSLGENCLYVEVLDKKQVKQKAKGF
jgi:hypothetical protein